VLGRGAFPPHLGADKVLQVMTLIEGYCAHVGLDAKRMPAAGSRFESRSLGRVVCCECCSSKATHYTTVEPRDSRDVIWIWTVEERSGAGVLGNPADEDGAQRWDVVIP
jgi:hypothetical protein